MFVSRTILIDAAGGASLEPPLASEGYGRTILPLVRLLGLGLPRGEVGHELGELVHVARALDTSWPAAQRLEQPGGNPTLEQLERAAAALGKRLVVGLS